MNKLLVMLLFIVVSIGSYETANAGILSDMSKPRVKVYSGIVTLMTTTPTCSECPAGWTVAGTGFTKTVTHNLNLSPTNRLQCLFQPIQFAGNAMIVVYSYTANSVQAAVFDPTTAGPQAGLTDMQFICHLSVTADE